MNNKIFLFRSLKKGMDGLSKFFLVMLVTAIVALAVIPLSINGEEPASTLNPTVLPTKPVLTPTPTPIGVLFGLIAATLITIIVIYMLRRMKDQRPILGL